MSFSLSHTLWKHLEVLKNHNWRQDFVFTAHQKTSSLGGAERERNKREPSRLNETRWDSVNKVTKCVLYCKNVHVQDCASSVCAPCDRCPSPEVELKSLGRRVNWMFTHAETDAHKHSHTRQVFLAAFHRRHSSVTREKSCRLSGGASPRALRVKWRMKTGLANIQEDDKGEISQQKSF